jgi:DNA-binding MarR family transcriptional regulator
MMGVLPRRSAPTENAAPPPEELAERLISFTRAVGKSSARSQLGPLSAARYEVLHAIFHAGPLPMSQVAARLQVSPRTVTDLVDGLEADGFVVRGSHPTDRRKTVLSLTEGGLGALANARKARIANAAEFLTVLDPAERSTLAALLDKVIAAVRPQ